MLEIHFSHWFLSTTESNSTKFQYKRNMIIYRCHYYQTCLIIIIIIHLRKWPENLTSTSKIVSLLFPIFENLRMLIRPLFEETKCPRILNENNENLT